VETKELRTPTGSGSQVGAVQLSDLLQADKAAYGITRLCANSEPMLDALVIQLQLRGLFQWIVRPHQFHDAAIARPSLLNHYDAIVRLLLLANARQPK